MRQRERAFLLACVSLVCLVFILKGLVYQENIYSVSNVDALHRSPTTTTTLASDDRVPKPLEYTDYHINGVDSIPIDFLPLTTIEQELRSNNYSLTREYQIKLHKDIIFDRSFGLEEFYQDVTSLFNLSPISPSLGKETIRYQYCVDSTYCGKSYNLRIRKYLSGHKNQTKTFDLKSKTPNNKLERFLMTMYEPNEKYTNNSLKKFELDVHPCHSSYSKMTAFYIPFDKIVTTCSDIVDLIPITQTQFHEPVSDDVSLPIYATEWWYEMEHRGVLWDGVTPFKASLTISYSTKRNVFIGKGGKEGEFSIRVWSSEGGFGPWPKKTIETLEKNYLDALLYLKTDEDPCEEESAEVYE